MRFVLIALLALSASAEPTFSLDGPSSTIIFNSSSPYTLYNEDKFTLYDAEENELMVIDLDEDLLEFDRRVEAHADLHGNIESEFRVRDFRQWKLFAREDFQGAIVDWSDDSIGGCGTNPDLFLGGPCKYADTSVSKTWDLPEHEFIQVKATVHFFDHWEGESVYVKVDDNTVWSESYETCTHMRSSLCLHKGLDLCGDEYPDRIGVPVHFSGPHTEDLLTFEIGSDLARESCEVSWGFDDVEIYIK